MKHFGEKEAWAYPWTAQFFGYPLLSHKREKLQISVHPNKIPLKSLEKIERGRIQGLPNFWGYPLLCQEWEKLYGFKIWPVYIQSVHPNKSPLKIFEKKERGRIQGLPNFFGCQNNNSVHLNNSN